MREVHHEPAGFCPICDYAIDPGLCPECGNLVKPDRLRRCRRSVRLKRSFYRAGLAFAVVTLGVSLYWGIRHELQPHRWVRWCSSAYLIDLEKRSGKTNVKAELNRRFTEHLLTKNDTIALLTIRTELPEIPIQSPRPAGIKVVADGQLEECPGTTVCYFGTRLTRFPCILGEEVVEDLLFLDGKRIGSKNILDEHELNIVRNLPAGQYEIIRQQTIRYEALPKEVYATLGQTSPTHMPSDVTVSFTREIAILDKAPTHFVNGEYSPYDQNWVHGTHNYPCDISAIGVFENGITSPPLAGYVKVEIPHDEPDQMRTRYQIPQQRCELQMLLRVYASNELALDISYTPDAATAFDAGYQSYFNGVMRWNAVKLNESIKAPTLIKPLE